MKFPAKLHLVILLIILPFLFIQNSGCEKEYSFEGADTATVMADTAAMPVSQPSPVVQLTPQCALCHFTQDIALGTWDFTAGNSYICGGLTNSGYIGGNSKTDFTFFGPSPCSTDTGVVVSAYMPVPLDQNRNNITSSAASFYYYDNHAANDIFITRQSSPFTVTVQSFVNVTGIAIGTFSGIVFTPAGDTVYITNGRFKVKL